MNGHRLKVMQLGLTLDTGGLERVVVNLANELARSGRVQASICTVGQTRADLIPSAIVPDVDWAELAGPPHFSFKTALQLARYVRKNHIQVVHAHGTQPLVYALVTSLLTKAAVVFSKHNSYEDLDFFMRHRFFYRLACRRVRQFVGVSEQATQILQRVFKPVARRCQTLINGTELPSPTTHLRAHVVRGAGALNAPFVIVTVCRLAPEKDLATLLRAFAVLRAANVGADLWIVGDGPEREQLTALADQLRIRPHVRFWGFRGKIQQVLTCSDLFVNSSLTEGISISILEAMSMGLPVVATAVGGTPSIVRHGETGLLVEPGHPQHLAAAMLSVIRDPRLRLRFGEAGYKQVEQHWSLGRMAERYLQLYEAALQLPPHAPVAAA